MKAPVHSGARPLQSPFLSGWFSISHCGVMTPITQPTHEHCSCFGQPNWPRWVLHWEAAEGKPLQKVTGMTWVHAAPPRSCRPLQLWAVPRQGGKKTDARVTSHLEGHREPLTVRGFTAWARAPELWKQRLSQNFSGSGHVGASERGHLLCYPGS